MPHLKIIQSKICERLRETQPVKSELCLKCSCYTNHEKSPALAMKEAKAMHEVTYFHFGNVNTMPWGRPVG